MPDAPADNRMLVRRTLITVGAMVGACVVAVGGLTLVAVTVVAHTVGAPSETTGGASSSSAPGAIIARPRGAGRLTPTSASTKAAQAPQGSR